MTDPTPPQDRRERTPDEVKANFMQRRRDKIVEEIQRNRRGEYTVPTWVLAALLVAIVAGFIALLLLAP
ncbi:MAG TPA: hypothetical protein VFC19_16945 [Candidatus Limnocylindrales bacterium]|nr:hypothetical protein [Candidatus Limnocylindrales bacterium]